MIEITELAREQIREDLKNNFDKNYCFSVKRRLNGGFKYFLSLTNEIPDLTLKIYFDNGVLYLDPSTEQWLIGTTIDWNSYSGFVFKSKYGC